MSAIDAKNILQKLKISNKVILDPFCGSGTLLIEASKQNKKVIGLDSNPIAYILGKAKINIQNIDYEIANFERIKKKIREKKLPQYQNQY